MAENIVQATVPDVASGKMVVRVKINGIVKQMQLSAPVCKIVTSFLVTAFLKNKETDSFETEEKIILYFISSGVPMVCVVFRETQYEVFEKQAKQYGIIYFKYKLENFSIPKDKEAEAKQENGLIAVFLRDADSVSFNELIDDTGLSNINNLGSIVASEPTVDLGNPQKTVSNNLTADKTVDINRIYKQYLEFAGDKTLLLRYVVSLSVCSELDEMVSDGKVKGIMIGPFVLDTNDAELTRLLPGSDIIGGLGDTDYRHKAELMRLEASRKLK